MENHEMIPKPKCGHCGKTSPSPIAFITVSRCPCGHGVTGLEASTIKNDVQLVLFALMNVGEELLKRFPDLESDI